MQLRSSIAVAADITWFCRLDEVTVRSLRLDGIVISAEISHKGLGLLKYPLTSTGRAALRRTQKYSAQARQIVRQAGLEVQDFAGFGVLEAQYMGVKGLSAKGGEGFPGVFRQKGGLRLEA